MRLCGQTDGDAAYVVLIVWFILRMAWCGLKQAGYFSCLDINVNLPECGV